MRNKGTIAALVIILVAGMGLYFAYVNRDIQGVGLPATTSASAAELWQTQARSARTTTQAASTAQGAATTTGSGAYPYDYPGIAPAVAAVPADPFLICVNRSYALPVGYAFTRAVCVEVYPEKLEMEKTAAAQYRLMYSAGLQDGVELVPYSGYRPTARQQANFDRKIQSFIEQNFTLAQAVGMAANSINPPGCSEHEAGLAMDITVKGVWNAVETFKNTKEYEWLMANAQDYGFILRYPREKEEITKVQFEPWHWRYVGVENAKKIKDSGKCLEEYLGLV